MSSGKLKAQYNRVRTSTALQSNSIWSKTIGVEQDAAGSNAAVEAALRAPVHGGGGGRAARREMAQQLIDAAGLEQRVTSFAGLSALARERGTAGDATRGACKLCGGLGHLTKQCRNAIGGSGANGEDAPKALAVAAQAALPLIPANEGDSDSLSSLSDSSSLSSDDSADRKRKRHKSSSTSKKKHKSKSSSKVKGRKRKHKHKHRKDKDNKSDGHKRQKH